MDWHSRYLQQASWTRALRQYVLDRAGIAHARRILEVGCGTGVILSETAQQMAGAESGEISLFGLDIADESLRQSRLHASMAELTRGDALFLPYADAVFDITMCHFLLLWVHDPLQALKQMRRVTRPGGYVLALAEPDYSERADASFGPSQLAALQERSLVRQGADTAIGARLADLFRQSSLKIVESGTIALWDTVAATAENISSEAQVLREDLRGMLPPDELERMLQSAAQAWRRGESTLHVPTYFAYAQV